MILMVSNHLCHREVKFHKVNSLNNQIEQQREQKIIKLLILKINYRLALIQKLVSSRNLKNKMINHQILKKF
jgi:hypothetical protein